MDSVRIQQAEFELARRLHDARLRRGWNQGELAERAGVSRTTLYHLERGLTRQPHAATLSRIAAALSIAPEELQPHGGGEWQQRGDSSACGFDRRTNPLVAHVVQEAPGLFEGWSRDDWRELFSAFGTGGALTAEGVRQTASQMNRRRQAIERLQVVMETHLADVAAALIDALYTTVSLDGGPGSAPAGIGVDSDST